MKKLQSLRFKMPIVIMVSVTVLTILLVSIIINIGSQGIEKTARTGFGTTTYLYSRLINVWLNELTTVGKQIVGGNNQLAIYLENPTPENNRNAIDRLHALSRGNDSIMSLYLINMEGKTVLDSENNLIVSTSSRDWLKTAAWIKLKNSNYDHAVFETDEASPIDKKTRVIQILIGIKSQTEKPLGAMAIVVDWDKFVAKEIKTLKIGKSGHAFVIDKDGWVIGDPIDSHVRSETLQKADFIQHAIKNKSGFLEFISPFNGRKSIVSFDTDHTTEWTIAISIEKAELYADVNTMVTIAIFGTITALIITSIVIVLFSRTITRPIRIITDHLTKLSNGDLTWEIEEKLLQRKDEFALIAKAKLNILERLGSTIKKVMEIAEQVSISSSEVAEGNNDLAHRTENQAASLEETASSMEEISSTIKSSTEYSVHGNKMMLESKSGIENAGTIISATTSNIEAVFEASSKITAITKIIESIAFQTNILALNAAVEAARAGEQGRGFAVVASEVRNLAQTTQTSVKDITMLIEDANDKIKLATDTARQSQEIFSDLQKHIDETAKIMKDINETAMEQLSGIEQVNKAVSEMDITTQKNAALVEESTAASETLHAQAKELIQAMSFFKINKTEK